MELERPDLRLLYEMGWRKPERVKVKAADGITDLYGVMYRPFDMDSTRKYPIIINVYPGPQENFVPQSFTLDDNGNESLAQLGFIVINVGFRGSCFTRGRNYHCFGYGNLRDYALADCKFVLEQLANRYSFIDLDRVGIYGHSGGGFMAAASILTYPDFYKVAVAASGNHDNNIYTKWWDSNCITFKVALGKNEKNFCCRMDNCRFFNSRKLFAGKLSSAILLDDPFIWLYTAEESRKNCFNVVFSAVR